MVFLGLAFIFRRAPTWTLALSALAFSYAVELSQFVQTPWLNAVRDMKLGGLVLGFGFKWTDLVCYAVGVSMGAAGDRKAARRSGQGKRPEIPRFPRNAVRQSPR